MRVFKPTARHRCWHCEFTDHRAIPRRLSTYQRDRGLALDCGNMIEVLVGARRNGETDPPARLHTWIDAMPDELRDCLLKWEVLAAAWWGKRTSMRVPLIETQGEGRKRKVNASCMLGQWGAALRGTNVTEQFARSQVNQALLVFEACEFARIEDIDSAAVSRVLLSWRQPPKSVSIRRSNSLRQSCYQFCAWLRHSFKVANPLDDPAILPKLNEATDRRRIRRGLDVDEARKLITVTATQPPRHGMTGLGRSIVYHLAIVLGFRHDEIRQLRRCDFIVPPLPTAGAGPAPGAVPHLIAPPQVTKNRQEAVIELPTDLADRLRTYFAEQLAAPTARAFTLRKGRGAEMLRDDLAAAGIAERDAAERVIDFHSLRHTTGCWGFTVHKMNPREVQQLMRVSDLKLVERYSSSLKLPSRSWINETPRLADAAAEAEKTG